LHPGHRKTLRLSSPSAPVQNFKTKIIVSSKLFVNLYTGALGLANRKIFAYLQTVQPPFSKQVRTCKNWECGV